MESSKAIYSRIKLEALSVEKMEKLKKVILQVLIDVTEACDENDIPYFIAYGTLLGAVRHKGYIPWDDDVDIHVRREDVPALEKALKNKFKDKYKFTEVKRRPINFFYVELAGTEAREVTADNDDIVSGIKIDVFPIDYISSNHMVAKIQEKLSFILVRAASLRRDFLYPSKSLLSLEDGEDKKYYRMRRILGIPFSILTPSIYEKLYVSLCVSKKKSKVVRITDEDIYMPGSIFDKCSEVEFEGRLFKCPLEYEKYLRIVYGSNYMELPPEDKREVHTYVNLSLGKYEDD